MIKKILVPTDFSKYANNALKIAFQVAKKTGAHVMVMHVTPSADDTLLAPDRTEAETELEEKYFSHLHDLATKNIQQLLEQEDFPKEKTSIRVIKGVIPQKIIDCSQSEDIDLIVMGTRGLNLMAEIFVGSNTEKVVRFAHCPVLTVKDQPVNFIVSNILFPTNFDKDQENAVEKIKEFQNLSQGHLHLLYVNTINNFLSTSEIEEKKNKFAVNTQLDNYTLHAISAKSEEAGIENATEMLDIDLIVICTHQRKGLSHFIAGSIAENLVNYASKPVLTIGINS